MARVKSDGALDELKAFAMAYPGTSEKAPWPGHNDVAVNDKTFVYLSAPGDPLGVGCKLPKTGNVALMLPWVTPMEYGMGKSGWVSAKPPTDQAVPIDMFKEWIDESYRAQAPKKLVAQIGTAPAQTATAKKPVATSPAKNPVAKGPATKSAAKGPATKSAAKGPATKSAPKGPATRSVAKKAAAKAAAKAATKASTKMNAKTKAKT